MSMNVNQDYSQFYAGTEQIKSYGSNPAVKKDTLVKYRFNTTDEHGNKVMDKMSKEETMKAVNDISSQYGDSVIVQFSGDGLAALAEGGKSMSGRAMTEEEAARDAAFQAENYLDESHAADFMSAMEMIAKYGLNGSVSDSCRRGQDLTARDIQLCVKGIFGELCGERGQLNKGAEKQAVRG